MSNYKVKIVDTNGVITATAEERTFLEACGDSITTMLSSDEGVVGMADAVVKVGLLYGGAVFGKYRHAGQLSFNPF